VGHVDVAVGGHGELPRAVERVAGGAAGRIGMPESAYKGAAGAELLHAVVPGVGHVDVAVRPHGEAHGALGLAAELAWARAGRAPGGQVATPAVELDHVL